MQQRMPLLLVLLSCFLWSALAACPPSGFPTWSSLGLPTNDASATVTLTQNVLLDKNITLNTLVVDSNYKLVVDSTKDVVIRVRMMYVNSDAEFWIGGEGCPYTKNAEIIFTGPFSANDDLGFGDKGMGVSGRVEWHGNPTNPTWTHLTQTALIGSNKIVVADAVPWKVGAQIVIASTDYDATQSEVVTIYRVQGNTITFNEPLKFMHWGAEMNYIDQRAEVGLLTKNIKVHGEIDPTDPNTVKGPKFGGHTMYQAGSTAHIENVQFYAMGQAGMLARYPVHFHAVFDMTGSYVKECAFANTFQRCITIHATHNLLIKDNVAYNSNGHCYFWEDGIEQGIVADHNLGVIANVVPDNVRIIPSDQTQTSIFWITHPNNTLKNNVAVGGVFGFWYALPENPIGLMGQGGPNPNVWPRYSGMGEGQFINNKAHSQSKTGLFVDQGPAANGDTSQLNSYTCRDFTLDPDWAQNVDINGLETAILDSPRTKPAKFENFVAHHCVENAAWLRGDNMIVDGLISADCQVAITMPGGPNLIQNAIIIGDTINPGNPSNKAVMQGRSRWYSWNVTYPMQGLRHYDCCGPNFMRNILFVNFTDFQYVFTGDKRKAGAVTFLNGDHPIPPNTRFWNIKFEDVTNRVYYLPDNTFRTALKYAFLVDGDGSFTGKCGSVIAPNNPILLRPQCEEVYSWNGYVCPPKTISPRYIEAADAFNFGNNQYLAPIDGTIVDDALDNYPNSSSSGQGVGRLLVVRIDDQRNNWISGPEVQGTNNGTHVKYNMNYRQNLPTQTEYMFVFPSNYGTPKQLRIQAYNMPLEEYFRVVVPYPTGTTFVPRNVSGYINEPAINCNDNVNYPQWGNCPFTQVNSKSALTANTYYWDDARGLLWVQIQATSQQFSNSFGYTWPSASPAAVITATCPNNDCRVSPATLNTLLDYGNVFWNNPTPYTPPPTNLCYTNGYGNAGKKQYSELGEPYVLFGDNITDPWQLPTWSFNSSTIQSTTAASGSALQMFLNPWGTFQIRTPWNKDFGLGNVTNPGIPGSELALIFDVRMGAVPSPLRTLNGQRRDIVNIIAAVWEQTPKSRSWSISVQSPFILGGATPIDSTKWYHVVVPWSQFPNGGIPADCTTIIGVGIGVSEAFQSTIFVDNVKLQYVTSSFAAQSMPTFTKLTTHPLDPLKPYVPVDAFTSGCQPCGLTQQTGGSTGCPSPSSSSDGFDGKAGAILVFAILFAVSAAFAIYFYYQLHQKQQIPQLEPVSPTSP